MADIIQGPVMQVVDGDTFEIRVTHVGKDNRHEYGDMERIRIFGVNAPELNEPEGQEAKEQLEEKMGGTTIQCMDRSRGTHVRLICDVEIVTRD